MSQFYQRLIAGALSILLLGAGVAIGIILQRSWLRDSPGPEGHHGLHGGFHEPPPMRGVPPTDHMFRRFQQELNLTEEQAPKVRAILDQVKEGARAVHEELRPRLGELMRKADGEIRAVLKEEQQTRYDELVRERKERFKKRRHHRKGRHRGHRGSPPHAPPGTDAP